MGPRNRGRPESVVDPEAGPIQGFASGLRQLRASAGLTYKRLSEVTSYAANTLSQAADGKRIPSKELTRAYVLACGGEPEEWEHRRQLALRSLAEDGLVEASGGATPPESDEDPSARPPLEVDSRRSEAGLGILERRALAVPGRLEQLRQITTQVQFGQELTLLRDQANLSVRDAAADAGLPLTTAGGYFAGTHLPTPKLLATQFPKLLQVLGVHDTEEVEAWTEAVRRMRRLSRQRTITWPDEQPYRGLARFEPEDAPWFFGRAELTGLLVDSALRQRDEGLPLFAIGASGAGKSSVLRAGLIPALPEAASVALCTPGRDPQESIEEAVARTGSGKNRWIVVDQFEELFTHDITPEDQAAAIDALLRLASPAEGGERLGVVVGMRADFYVQALAHPGLAPVLQDGQVVVGAMNRDQLREAIAGPAQRAGVRIEDGLVELLIEQCAELGRQNAGALPLLAHALLATWDRHDRGVVTTADYMATGGVAHAIAQSAEDAYNELTTEQQDLARRIFLQLVHVAEDTADTARKVRPEQLPGVGTSGDLPEAIGVFVERRLLTADEDTLQITHEALLDSWPRLRSWLGAGRADLLAQHRTAAAAEAWQQSGRDPDALLRGALLVAAESRLQDPSSGWRPLALERELLAASTARRRLEERARQRATRRLLALALALAFLFLVAAGAAAYAFGQRQNAQAATRLADSRAVAESAVDQRGLDPSVAAQLSLSGYRIAQTPEARAALLESTDTAQATREVDGSSVLQALAVAESAHLLAAVDADGTVRLWNIADPGHPTAIGRPLIHLANAQQFAGAISANGHRLAVGGADEVVRLWNITNPARPVQLPTLTGPANTVYALAFSPNTSLLAAASADGTVRTWRVAGNNHVVADQTLAATTGYAQSVAFSPDGRTLAAGTSDGKLVAWSVSSSGVAGNEQVHTGLGGPVLGVAFSPNGHSAATGTQTMALQFWNLLAPGDLRTDASPITASTSWINALSFSPDGAELAVATSANTVQLWSTASHTITTELPHPEPVASLAWAGTRTLITGGNDGILRLWALPIPQLAAQGVINNVAYSLNGSLLAIGSNTLQLWSTKTMTPIGAPIGPATLAAEAIAFSPTAPVMAVGYGDGSVRLWNIANPTHPVMVGGAFMAAQPGYTIESIAFNNTGTVLATGADDTTVHLFDTSALPGSGATPGLVLTGFKAKVFDVTFGPDGHTLAAASIDGTVRLWHVTDATHATLLGHPLTGFPGYVYSVAFNPRQSILAVGSSGSVQLFDIANPSDPVTDGPAITGPSGYVYSLSFNAEGTVLAGAITDHNLWLWDVTDPHVPTALATLTGSAQSLYTVDFDPAGSGSLLADGGADGVVRLWQTDAALAEQQLCSTVGQTLSPSDWAEAAPGLPFTPPCG